MACGDITSVLFICNCSEMACGDITSVLFICNCSEMACGDITSVLFNYNCSEMACGDVTREDFICNRSEMACGDVTSVLFNHNCSEWRCSLPALSSLARSTRRVDHLQERRREKKMNEILKFHFACANLSTAILCLFTCTVLRINLASLNTSAAACSPSPSYSHFM